MVPNNYHPKFETSDIINRYTYFEDSKSKYNKPNNLSITLLTTNCWLFITTEKIEDSNLELRYQFYEIVNFSSRKKFEVLNYNKIKLLCIQFEQEFSIQKILGSHYEDLVEKVFVIMKKEKTEKEINIDLDDLFKVIKTTKSYKQDITSKIINYIYENPKAKVDDLSKQLYLCPRQLRRVFQEQTGYNIKSYQKHIRITLFLHLILNTENTNLHDLIFSLGFYDHTHFIKEFKSYIGITPFCFLQNKPLYCDKFLLEEFIN